MLPRLWSLILRAIDKRRFHSARRGQSRYRSKFWLTAMVQQLEERLQLSATTIALDTTVNGTLSHGDSTQLFEFSATAHQMVHIDVSNVTTTGAPSSNDNIQWILIDPAGRSVGPDGSSPQIQSPFPSDTELQLELSGVYTLIASGAAPFSASTNYSFRVVTDGSTPIPLSLDSTVSGSLGNSLQGNTYSFTLTKDDQLWFDSQTNSGQLYWTIKGTNYFASDNFNDNDNFGPNIGVLLPGAYTITIASTIGQAADYAFEILEQTNATPLSMGVPVTSGPSPANGAQIYQFAATAGQTYDLNFTNLLTTNLYNSAISWALYGSAGTNSSSEMISNNSTLSPNETIQFTPTTTDQYTLVVLGSVGNTGTTSYNLELGSPAVTTTSVALDTTISANMDSPSTTQNYVFDLTSPTLLWLNTQSDNSNLTWSLSGVRAVDGVQTQYASNYDGGFVDLGMLPAGHYDLTFSGIGFPGIPAGGLQYGSGSGAYSFRFYNPTAAPLIAPGSSVSGTVGQTNSAQFYQISGTTGQHLTFTSTVASGANYYPGWSLYDEAGHVLFSSLLSQSETVTIYYSGTYLLRVDNGYLPSISTNYSFNVAATAGPPISHSTVPLTLNQPISGNAALFVANYYSFTVTSPEQLLVNLNTNGAPPLWYITGPMGLLEVNDYSTLSRGFTAGNILLFPGTYTLVIYNQYSGTVPYTLNVMQMRTPTVMTAGVPTTGITTPTNPTQIYQITVPANEQTNLTMSVISTSGNVGTATCAVYDQAGNVLPGNLVGGSPIPLNGYAWPVTYTVVVYGAAGDTGTTTYSLNASPPVSSIAPSAPPTPLVLNEPTTGVITPTTGGGTYTITLTQDTHLYFNDFQSNGLLEWSIYPSDGRLIEFNNRQSDFETGNDIGMLPAGTYTFQVYYQGSSSELPLSYSFSLTDVASGTPLTIGTPFVSAPHPSSESEFYQFSVTSDESVELQPTVLSSTDSSSSGGLANWVLYSADGSEYPISDLIYRYNPLGGPYRYDLTPGTYYLVSTGFNGETGITNESVVLTPVTDVQNTLQLNSLVTGTNTVAGQQQEYSFTLSAPTHLWFDSESNTDGAGWQLRGPDGFVDPGLTYFGPPYLTGFNLGGGDLGVVPAGQYTLTEAGLGAYAFRLFNFQAGTQVTPGPNPIDIHVSSPSSTELLQFKATPGESLLVGAALNSTTDTSGQQGDATIRLFDQFGGEIFEEDLQQFSTSSFPLNPQAGGTYYLMISGLAGETGSTDYSVNLIPYVNQTAPMTLNSPVVGNLSVPTQIQSFTFTLTSASELYFDSQTNTEFEWDLYGPGSAVHSQAAGTFGFSDGFIGHFSPGSYRLTVSGAVGQFAFQLSSLANGTPIGVGTSASPTGATVTGSLNPANSANIYTFTATAGSQFTFHDVLESPRTGATWQLFDPNGTSVFKDSLATDQTNVNLAFSGQYSLVVNAPVSTTVVTNYQFQVNYQTPPAPLSFTGIPLTFGATYTNLTNPVGTSDEVDYVFSLATSTSLWLSGGASSAVGWQLVGPQGNLTQRFANGTTSSLASTNLWLGPLAAGSYEFRILSPSGQPYGFSLSNVASATTYSLGTTVHVTNPSSNAVTFYQFMGTAGQLLQMNSQNLGYTPLYDPYGSRPTYIGNASGPSFAGFSQFSLPNTGLYYFSINSSQSYSFSLIPVRLNTPPAVTTSLTFDAPFSGTISQPGQEDQYTFTLDHLQELYLSSLIADPGISWNISSPSYPSDFAISPSYLQSNPTLGSGNYTLTIYSTTGQTGAYSFNLLSIPQIPAIATTDAGGVYNGNPFTATANVTGFNSTTVSGSTTFTYYVGNSISGTGSSSAPVNVGTYTVVASFTSSDPNYGNVSSAPVTFTITQATPTVVVTDAGGTFNGHAFAATAKVTGVGGATVTGATALTYYVGSSVSGTGSSTAPTNAGTYTVVASFASGDANYVSASSAPLTFTISTATPSILVTHSAANYSSLPSPAKVTVTGIGGVIVSGSTTLTYYSGSTVSGTGTTVAPTNAGTYTVVASFTSSDPNYANGSSAPLTFTIGQATPVSQISIVGGVFTGNPYLPTARFIGFGGVTVMGTTTFTYYTGSTVSGTGTSTPPSNAGTYTVVASFASGDPNYVNAISNSVTFTISKATPKVIATDVGGTFSGNSFSATAAVTGAGGATVNGTTAFTYYVGSSVSGTGSSTAPTNVGTYTVVAAFTSSDANYNNTSGVPVTFTITKAIPAVVVTDAGGTFNGSAFPATAKVTGAGGVTIAGTTTLTYNAGSTVSGTGSSTAPRNAGTYTVVAAFASSDLNYGNATSLPVTFTIAKATPVIVATDAGGVYTASPFVATAQATGVGGVAVAGTTTFTYYAGIGTNSADRLASAPVAASTFTVVAVFTSSDPNYGNSSSAPVTFTITPATPSITISDAGGTFDYSDFPPTVQVIGANGILFHGLTTLAYYAGSSASGPQLSQRPVDPGTYTVVATAFGNPDYITTSSAPVTFTITKATPTVVTTDTGGTFNGSSIPATAKVNGIIRESVSGSTGFTYYVGSSVSGTGSTTAPANAGTYTVVAAFISSNPDYANASSAPVTFTIGQATPTVVATDAGGTFNSHAFPATAKVTGVGGAAVSGTTVLTYYVGSSVSGTGSSTAPTNAGTYTAVASFTSTNVNYANANSAPVTFTIGTATPAISVFDSGGKYSSNPFPATVVVTGVGGVAVNGSKTVTYYSGSSASGTGTTVAPTNAGTYTVVASFTSSDANYANRSSAPLTFTIGQATPVSQITIASGVFTGNPYVATARFIGFGGVTVTGTTTFTYYLGSTASGTGSQTPPTNVGTYTVVASFVSGDPNYINATSNPITFTIAPATPKIVVTTAADAFNGKFFLASAVTKAVGGTLVSGATTFAYYEGNSAVGTAISPAPINSGTYTVVATFTSDDANYANATSAPVTFTIAKATPKVVVTDVGGTFNGSAFPATAQTTGVAGALVTGTTVSTYYVGSSVSGTGSSTAPTNAGTYTVVTAFTSSDPNYANSSSAPVTFTIATVTPTVVTTAVGGLFNGNSFPATAKATGIGGTAVNGTAVFTYYVGSSVSGTGSSTAPTNAGTYTVTTAFTSSNPNYGNASGIPVTFTIISATPTVTTTDVGGTFNGSAFPATVKATGVGGATVAGSAAFTYYVGSSVNGTGSSTAPTNAGTYTVVAAFTSSDANYGNSSSAPVTFTIAKATPTVVASDSGGTFNGNAFPATAVITGVGGATVTGTTTFTYYVGNSVSGTGSSTTPTNAGTFTVVATFVSSDQNYGSASSSPVTFTIAKATPTLVATDLGGTYNRSPFTATAVATGVGGATVAGTTAFTYYIGASASGPGFSTAPIGAGTFTVVAAFTSSDPNYGNASSAAVTFTIAKAVSTVTASDAGGVFNGNPYPATAQVTGIGGITVNDGFSAMTYYTGSNASGTPLLITPTAAGTYTVVATFLGDANYLSATSSPVTFAIAQATPMFVATDMGGTFNGSSFPATASATGVGGATVTGTTAFTYYVGSSVSGTGSSTAPTNAGTYTVIAAFTSGDPNYGNASSAPVSFTIAKATPTAAATNVGGTFNGSSFPATANATGVGGVTVSGTAAFNYYVGSSVSGTGTSTAPTNAGTYTVVAAFTSSDPNYGNASAPPVTFTIAQTMPTVVATDAGGAFNGSAFPATAQATGVGGATVSGTTAFTYYVGSSVSGTGSSTAPTNVGTYTVVAAFTSSNANYGNASSAPVTFTINKATPTIVVTDVGGAFNGSSFPATAKATGVGGATVTGTAAFTYYVGSSVNGTGSSTAPTNAGTYTVVAAFTSSNANYGNASSTSVTFIIAKATPAVVATDAGGTFNGHAFPATVTVKGAGGAAVQGTSTFTYYTGTSVSGVGTATAPTNPGTYTVVAAFTSSDGNYLNATSAPVTFTISPSASPVAPVVITNPTNQSAVAGHTVTFIAAASGSPAPTVIWQVSTNGGTTFTNVPGATSATLNFTTTAAENGYKFRAIFTNSQGTVMTTVVTLTVN